MYEDSVSLVRRLSSTDTPGFPLMNWSMKCAGVCSHAAWQSSPRKRGGCVAETERDILFQVLDALEALQIPYHDRRVVCIDLLGRPRMTHDADLVVEITGREGY